MMCREYKLACLNWCCQLLSSCFALMVNLVFLNVLLCWQIVKVLPLQPQKSPKKISFTQLLE